MFGWIEEGIECNRAITTYREPYLDLRQGDRTQSCI